MSQKKPDSIINTIKAWVESYMKTKNLTATEFVEKQFTNPEFQDEDVAKYFLKLWKHKEFLELLAKNYNDFHKIFLKKHEKLNLNLQIMIYLIIFEVNEETIEKLKPSFMDDKIKFFKVLQFFKEEENLIKIVEDGCSKYCDEYILENVVKNLVANINLIKKMYNEFIQNKLIKKFPVKTPIKSKTTKQSIARVENPNIEEETRIKITPTPLPKTTYQPDEKLTEKLLEARKNNKEKAQKLLEQAKLDAFNCCNITPKKQPEIQKFRPVQPTRLPKFGEVFVKTNAATLRRETALLTKEKEKEIKEIEELISGSLNDSKFQELELEFRQVKHQEFLQEIERKHLQGLLTYEEAKIAKKKLQQDNKNKIREFQEIRQGWLNELELWKEAELTKNATLIDKAQQIKLAAKEAENKMLEEKKYKVKIFQLENKKILQEAYDAKNEELKQKIMLIREFRWLQQIRNERKEFDRTECSNLGLLCEMSIAELQERLNMLRIRLSEELDERRKKILAEKAQQAELMDQMRKFIEESKKCKISKDTLFNKVEVEDTKDITDLKERLKRAKIMNLNMS